MSVKTAIIFSLLLFFLSVTTRAQKYTVSGSIKDQKTGEAIIGAAVRVQELPAAGAVSNEYGFYSLTLPKGSYTIVTQFVSYQADTFKIDLNQDVKHPFSLASESTQLKETVVTAERKNENITNAETGVERLDMVEINKIPVLFGERDILKTIQLLPGIKSAGEGNSGFNVRGGTNAQNLILLDEAVVYNASHLLGFFSTFNSDAIKDAIIYKGTQPAQFGGRLSSALDIRMKEGNKKSYEVDGSIGLITTKLSVEGPIVKDQGSFFIAARATYLDLFLLASPKFKSNKIDFYDLNGKLNYRLSEKDVIYVSGYFGRDQLAASTVFGLNWGNGVGTIRWNHILNSRVFSNTTFTYSNYQYNVNLQSAGSSFNIKSVIQDYNLKHEFQYFPSTEHTLRFGVNTIVHNITPGQVTTVTGDTSTNQALQNRYSWENAIYASDEWKVVKWLTLNMGVRGSSFSVLGPGDFYILNSSYDTIGTKHFGPAQFVTTYFDIEPRFTADFILSPSNSIKLAYDRNTQNLHLLSNSTSGSPTDKWIPDNNNIKPEIADQVSLGYFQNVYNNMFEFSLEGYFKYMQHVIDYKDGADILFNDAIETQLLSGIGRAYGMEFLMKKKAGKLTGWIGYTLSRTERKIAGINDGDWYKSTQDETHALSIVVMYDVSKKVTLASTWVYNTGNAVTFPTGKYYVDGQVVWEYTNRNVDRMPAYHRLDFSATIKLKDHKHYTNNLSFSLYNVYGRENAYSITFEQDAKDPSKTDAVQTSLFRWVPSISWDFKIK